MSRRMLVISQQELFVQGNGKRASTGTIGMAIALSNLRRIHPKECDSPLILEKEIFNGTHLALTDNDELSAEDKKMRNAEDRQFQESGKLPVPESDYCSLLALAKDMIPEIPFLDSDNLSVMIVHINNHYLVMCSDFFNKTIYVIDSLSVKSTDHELVRTQLYQFSLLIRFPLY